MSITQLSAQERLRSTTAIGNVRGNAAYAAAAAPPTRRPDEVSISSEAKAIATANTAVASAPEIRADRVEAIRAAIADGTYTIDSRALARAMVDKLGSI
jgi:negative regulator of flagellin synthesis FlgM